MEGTRWCSSQFIRDETGKLLRDPQEILQRWKRHFESLLNGSTDKLNPATLDLVAEHPLKQALDAEPSVAEVEQALRQLANGKAMGPDNLPPELLKLADRGSHEILRAFHGVLLAVWREEKVPQVWKGAVFLV